MTSCDTTSQVTLATRLLRDERVEVREKAGKVLGGLLHCSFISKPDAALLLEQFTKEIAKKIRKKPKGDEDPADFQTKQTKAVLLRHAGTTSNISFATIIVTKILLVVMIIMIIFLILINLPGVLGLSAFVVSCPYDIPERYIPVPAMSCSPCPPASPLS